MNAHLGAGERGAGRGLVVGGRDQQLDALAPGDPARELGEGDLRRRQVLHPQVGGRWARASQHAECRDHSAGAKKPS